MTNSADPDQVASSEANWSGSTLFAIAGHIDSAGSGLNQVKDRPLKGTESNSVLADQRESIIGSSLCYF